MAKARQSLQSYLEVDRIREDFPILRQQIHGKPLVYLDNAATTQKPRAVIEAISRYYELENSNIHRGVHFLSEQASRHYEEARSKVKHFLNAAHEHEIVFVRGATEGINLVAQSYGRKFIKPGDEIILTEMEHHSNIVPWQILCEQVGARLRVVSINEKGELLLDEYAKLLNERTRLVSIAHVSNALGTINPVRQIIKLAHQWNIPVLVDGAQAVPHLKVDVQELGCDFYVFSGHKLYGPTGIGVLYGKAKFLEVMPPYQGGGDMIRAVTFEKTLYNTIPFKFEAGTPHIAGGIGLGAAINYVSEIGLDKISTYEEELLHYATDALSAVKGVNIIGTAKEKAAVLSFIMEGVHPHDIGTILDHQGVAIRTGHHCAQPVMQHFGIPASARVSMAFYNTKHELDIMTQAVQKVRTMFHYD
ncbi:MAG: cysteine desulfurase [Nitrospira sp.]|nr:cysteine desulfurase [Nitrospira sp.]